MEKVLKGYETSRQIGERKGIPYDSMRKLVADKKRFPPIEFTIGRTNFYLTECVNYYFKERERDKRKRK